MEAKVIDIKGLRKSFGKKEVLRDVSLQIPSGCVFALLGENGAGKTTLMRMLMGYSHPDAGEMQVAGLSPQKDTFALRRKVGYVSDMPALYEWMTVAEIAWFCSAFFKEGYSKNFAQWATQFELPQNTRIRHLSKGMRAKTALALVLAADPEVLVFDEPTSGLDPLVRRDFLRSMVDLAAQGKTVVISSHQVQEIERVADRVAILHHGHLALAGELEDLKDSISMLQFSMRDPLVVPPESIASLSAIHYTLLGRTIRLAVRDLRSDFIEQLQGEENVSDVRVVRPSLEDLFVISTRASQLPPWQKQEQRGLQSGELQKIQVLS
jgi:ABC-2 type transport system ATP-binding protein